MSGTRAKKTEESEERPGAQRQRGRDAAEGKEGCGPVSEMSLNVGNQADRTQTPRASDPPTVNPLRTVCSGSFGHFFLIYTRNNLKETLKKKPKILEGGGEG